jgi:DMSO/TMAO reductase YedYZ molybdopterin-dependent catalytic subunit
MDPDKEKRLFEPRRKLVESKERWAKEGRLLTGHVADPAVGRLPPGQKQVKDWPVLDLGNRPGVSLESWRLKVDGLVAHPFEWSWKEFQDQPQFHSTSDIHCVTAWSRFDNHWEGVSAKHILSLAKPLPEARFVVFHSSDGYTTNLPLADFDADDALVAYSWEGKPLPREHGGPARVVVPKLYFWKSAKWVNRIELVASDRPGFWEVRGYHDHGDPCTEERYG